MVPATFVVNSIFDQPAVDPSTGAETSSGSITLRSAIQAANVHPNDASGPDRIEFNIPGSDVHILKQLSLFPVISDPIVIDGYTQPGARPNTLPDGDDAVLKINVDGTLGFATGLTITAGNSTVRGLVFTHFSSHALTLTDKGGNVVVGNFFGLPASGGVAISNNIALYVGFGADGNTIGGTDPADRNVIGGNSVGLKIVASSNNVVQGNYIGLDTSRSEPLGNGQGIVVTSGVAGETTGPATGNLIGGTVAGARNIISGNGGAIIFGGDQASLTSGNLVQGNYIGTDIVGAGNAHFHNIGPGVLFASGVGNNPGGARLNTIGGSTAAARNIIANSDVGIEVDTGATDNLIQGNYIGTGVTGTTSFGNSTAGILVHGSRTIIVNNVVSGNRVDGILVERGDETNIQGNLIGTNAAGTAALQNQFGIRLSGSNHATIGGTTTGDRNVISGNQLSGVLLEGFGVGNKIQGNLIGTDSSGTGRLGNGVDGIMINLNESGWPSGGTQIGGSDPGAGNVIAFNAQNGVDIVNSTLSDQADGTIESNTIYSNVLDGVHIATLGGADPHYRVTRNSIYSNGDLGIDLGGDGVTSNDSRGHLGPNNFQNFPLLTSVSASSTDTQVSGTLKCTALTTFRIEFFANALADPSGHGEGQTFLGSTDVTTDSSGNAVFTNVELPPAPAGQAIVAATATDPDGNTSEFSAMVQAIPAQTAADLAISMTAAPSPVELGANLTYTITVRNNGPDAADQVAFTTGVPTASTFVSFAAPSGWTPSLPPAGDMGSVSATIVHIESGATAAFSFVVRVDDPAPSTTTLTAIGAVTSDTGDPDTSNNSASASANVPPVPDHTDLAIAVSATPNSVRQGQALTYTITVTNNGPIVAGNVVMTLNTPSQTTFQSVAAPNGWQTESPSVGATGTITETIGNLQVGASAVFTVAVGVDSAATVGSTITGVAHIASETLDSNPANNTAQDSAIVTQPPVEPTPTGTPPGEPSPPSTPSGDSTPLKVLKAVRYGFHHQATILVVTFSTDWSSDVRSNPSTYTVLVSPNGTQRAVPISRVFFDSDTHRATLRVSKHIYVFRPWWLLVRDSVTAASGHADSGDGLSASGRKLVTRMNRQSLVGRASQAPGASHVGIKPQPGGPLAATANRFSRLNRHA